MLDPLHQRAIAEPTPTTLQPRVQDRRVLCLCGLVDRCQDTPPISMPGVYTLVAYIPPAERGHRVRVEAS